MLFTPFGYIPTPKRTLYLNDIKKRVNTNIHKRNENTYTVQSNSNAGCNTCFSGCTACIGSCTGLCSTTCTGACASECSGTSSGMVINSHIYEETNKDIPQIETEISDSDEENNNEPHAFVNGVPIDKYGNEISSNESIIKKLIKFISIFN